MRVSPPRASAIAGALGIGAGLAHVAAADAHAGQDAAVLAFLATAALQVLLGVAALVRPSRGVLLLGAGVNAVAAAAWVATRTTGLSFISDFAEREAAGLADVLVVVAEAGAVAAALVAARLGAPRPRLSPVLVLAVVPVLVGLAAPATHTHTHTGADDHHEVAAGHGDDGHTHAPAKGLAADPVFAGLETAHASDAELRAAKRLIETTRAAVSARFPDQASLLAAGYRSIGDGLVTPYDHFIRADYLNDGRELDPERVESIVMERTPTGWRVASAMFILEQGKTMADVPNVAGDLTVWHDHQNLCWDRSGLRLAGLLLNGKCFPAGTFRPTPPMLHVWLQDHPCGPFAGIEGHGGGCQHGH